MTFPFMARKPFLPLMLTANGKTHTLFGIVDSGADRSLLPKAFAPQLGIPVADLVPTQKGSLGAGGAQFKTWDLPPGMTIQAQILVGTPTGIATWGKSITLSPQFSEGPHTLWGRADFFQEYLITFGRHPLGGEIFQLMDLTFAAQQAAALAAAAAAAQASAAQPTPPPGSPPSAQLPPPASTP